MENKKKSVKTEKTSTKSTGANNDFLANCENLINSVVKNTEKLKSSVGKYSNEGLSNSIPLTESFEKLRQQVMENAKSLGHNDLVSYMKDNFNKKHVKKLVFEEINYPNKNDLNQDGTPKRDKIFEHLFDRSLDIAIAKEFPENNLGLTLVDGKFMVVSKLAYPQIKVIGAKGVDWQKNNSDELIPLTTRLLAGINASLKPNVKRGKGKSKGDKITLAKNINTMTKIIENEITKRANKENHLLNELNSNSVKDIANLIKLLTRLQSQYQMDLSNSNEDGHNQVKELIKVGDFQFCVYDHNKKAIATKKIA
tara:strand:- start:141 stop:1070 length:930 start_codon:yes stop_codon:yes gene_type:complete